MSERIMSNKRLQFIWKDVLPKMKDSKDSWPFRQPVDPVALNIPVCLSSHFNIVNLNS